MTSSQHVTEKFTDMKEFMNEHQFPEGMVLAFEVIYGEGCNSMGGMDSVKMYCEIVGPKPNDCVLDIGCGSGGLAFYLAENFQARVLGVDLSAPSIQIAKRRLAEWKQTAQPSLRDQVEFFVGDAEKLNYPSSVYDSVFISFVFTYIKDKLVSLQNFTKFLKPGGSVLWVDYFKKSNDVPPMLEELITSRGYFLCTTDQAKVFGAKCGLRCIAETEANQETLDFSQRELKIISEQKSEIEKHIGERWAEVQTLWQRIDNNLRAGNLCRGVLVFQKI